ncbi:MAG: ATP-binding protein [Clostridia bacterium]|nr:ATP-binding protein [Clostridia bacterium]
MQRHSSLIRKKYNTMLISTLAMTASMYLAGIVDSMMVGQVLGTVELSAINLTLSVSFLKSILMALFTFGGNTIAVIYKGKRENRKADAAFTLSFHAGMISSLVLMAIGLIFMKPTASLLAQGNEELQLLIVQYLLPLWLLTPFNVIVNHVAAFARTDGLNKLSTALPVVSNVINLVCDYVFMALLGMGIAGAGWATIAGYAVGTVMCIVYFRSCERSVKFIRLKKEDLRELGKIFNTGMPSALIYVCNFLRLFFMNAIILASTGTVGMQIASVSFSLNSLSFIVAEGASMTLLPMVGAFYGEKDLKGQRLTLRYGLFMTTVLCLAVMLISELFPAQLAGLYGLKDPAILQIYNTTFRILSINIPLLGIVYVMRTFFQGIKQQGIANLIVILDGFATVIPLLWLFSKYGIYWLWASFPVSKAVTIIITLIAVVICKKVQKKDNYLLMDSEEGVVMDFTIDNRVEAAVDASKKVMDFCRENAVDETVATRVAVAVEELCVNTAKYAYSPASRKVDIFIKISEHSIILRVRDNGKIFNPTEYEDDSGKLISGLSMLRAISSSIEYNRVIGFNTTVINIDLAQKG